jgi:hypothetical protein
MLQILPLFLKLDGWMHCQVVWLLSFASLVYFCLGV